MTKTLIKECINSRILPKIVLIIVNTVERRNLHGNRIVKFVNILFLVEVGNQGTESKRVKDQLFRKEMKGEKCEVSTARVKSDRH